VKIYDLLVLVQGQFKMKNNDPLAQYKVNSKIKIYDPLV